MKTLFVSLVLLLLFSINSATAQKRSASDYLNQLPKDLKPDNSQIRSYQMTTDYFDFNIKGKFNGKKRITGIITYGLKGDSASWKDVFISKSDNIGAMFPKGIRQDYLQNFKYHQDEKVITKEFFKDLPQADVAIQNLFWDMLGFYVLAYTCWDSLKLNEEFSAKKMNSEVNIADIGTFENREIRITWLGITEMNNEICAIIKYSAMNNPLKMEFENASMQGRSHYWGEIYVSLADKQIEYATLSEDVLLDIKIKEQTENILGYTIRNINLSRVK